MKTRQSFARDNYIRGKGEKQQSKEKQIVKLNSLTYIEKELPHSFNPSEVLWHYMTIIAAHHVKDNKFRKLLHHCAWKSRVPTLLNILEDAY
jgi:hypothetical protein